MIEEIRKDLNAVRNLAETILQSVEETEQRLDWLVYDPVSPEAMRVGDECRKIGSKEWSPVLNDGYVHRKGYEFRRRKAAGFQAAFEKESAALAEEFAHKGTLKHYLLRKGYMPHDEADAERIMDHIIEERELALKPEAGSESR